MFRFIVKIVLNGAVLYFAQKFFPGFVLAAGWDVLIIGALVLATLNIFVRPVLKIITTPLIWITLGLFNLVINMLILWMTDQILLQLTITDLKTLFLVSIITAIANIF